MKPLVESQNARRLLEALPRARALWLYRDFRDVAASIVRRWGRQTALDNLRPALAADASNWRGENVSPPTRATIARHFDERISASDAAALFWWMRNRLYVELGPEPRILPVRYEELAREPATALRRIYRFLDREYPGDHVVRDLGAGSIGRGRNVALSPQIEELCAELLDRLDRARLAAEARAGCH